MPCKDIMGSNETRSTVRRIRRIQMSKIEAAAFKPKRVNLLQIGKHILHRIQTACDFDGMTDSARLIARLIVVVLALTIIFIRMPIVFLHPAFWAEDAPFYFQQSYLDGWKIITTDKTGGYLTVFQWLGGNLSTYFPVSAAPAIFSATAISLTLAIVWLVTSPRLPLPAKPLLALAVVTVPGAYELLGALGNSQWIYPIGVFAILLMGPSKNRIVSHRRTCIRVDFFFDGAFLSFAVASLRIANSSQQRWIGCAAQNFSFKRRNRLWCDDRRHLHIAKSCRCSNA